MGVFWRGIDTVDPAACTCSKSDVIRAFGGLQEAKGAQALFAGPLLRNAAAMSGMWWQSRAALALDHVWLMSTGQEVKSAR